LLGDVDRLESALAEARAEREELAKLGDELAQARQELDGVRTTLAEEQERHAGERDELTSQRDELTAQRDRLAEELGNAFERLAVVEPAAEERDKLATELEELRATLAEVQESCAVEVRGIAEERDRLAAELEEAHELLRQAERVRESQIALEAERDRAVAEVERLHKLATEARAEAEEQTRLLAEEQDRHQAERETLVAQRTLLENELGSAIERLAAAAAVADEREEQLQLRSQRLLEALDVVRSVAAELVSGAAEHVEERMDAEDEPVEDASETSETDEVDEPEIEDAGGEPVETEAHAETDAETEAEAVEVEYSLFVPGPNGYELVPQTGIPPQAGQIVELVLPDRDEPVVYEVARSGRTLPDGDVCVYLAQV
jgi:chromosome segregation ATPase